MRRIPELGAMLVGGVLASKEPKKLIAGSGVHPEDMDDAFLSSVWTVLGQAAVDGQRIPAQELFAHGVTRRMISPDDLALLVSLQGRNTLVDETSFFRVAAELRRERTRSASAGSCSSWAATS
jgi:hypothetical protein